MFVQVIKGRASDSEGLRRRLDEWQANVRPNAIGFVGSTAGIAEDGTFIAIARFTDAAAAQENSSRPEQGAWWEETAKYFDGEPTFRESSDTSTLLAGGSNDARFVQVIEGTVSDRAAAEALESPEMLEQLRAARPDLIGALRVWFDGGDYLDVAYFTSEADARQGEQSAEFDAAQNEYAAIFGEPTFIDLREPLFD